MPAELAFYDTIKQEFEKSIAVKQNVLHHQVDILRKLTEVLVHALKSGKKLLVCGNGGSAADAQHIAAELVSKYKRVRRALPAIALTTDTSALTSAGNDFGYEWVFSRQAEALGQEGDVLLAISTSGNSPNVLRAVEEARKKSLISIAFTGASGGQLAGLTDFCWNVPSTDTARIQEAHITAAHAICEIIEQELC